MGARGHRLVLGESRPHHRLVPRIESLTDSPSDFSDSELFVVRNGGLEVDFWGRN